MQNERLRIRMYRGFALDGLTAYEQTTYDALIKKQANGTITSSEVIILKGLKEKLSDSSTQKGLSDEQVSSLLTTLSSLITTGAGIYSGSTEQRELNKKIKASCGNRPHGVLGIKSKKKKEEIAKWEKCAEGVIKQNQSILGGIGTDYYTNYKDDDEKKSGIGTFGWIAISVVAVSALAAAGYGIYKMTTKKNATVQA